MPVHAGHVALIEFAASQCDELIVSLSFTDDDVIPGNQRMTWLQEIFAAQSHILIKSIADDFDKPALNLISRTKIWANVIRQIYPRIDVLFSSEVYGEPF